MNDAKTTTQAEDGGPVETWDGTSRLDPARWGKDHWSLLGYVETRLVEHAGEIDPRHMRTDPVRHPQWCAAQLEMAPRAAGERCDPTLLAHGARLGGGHDDWDCADDLVAAGLLAEHPWSTGLQPRWRLTDLGAEMVATLRRFKGDGGSFARFAPIGAERLASRGGDGVG